jgi:hypothetical protein
MMYIENKGGGYVKQWGQQVPSGGELTGPGRIGRVTFSKTGKTIYYGGKTFNRWNGSKADSSASLRNDKQKGLRHFSNVDRNELWQTRSL